MAAEPWVNVYTPIATQGYIPSSPDYYSNNSNSNIAATTVTTTTKQHWLSAKEKIMKYKQQSCNSILWTLTLNTT